MERYQALSQALSKAAEREEAYWQGLERRLHELPDCFTRYLGLTPADQVDAGLGLEKRVDGNIVRELEVYARYDLTVIVDDLAGTPQTFSIGLSFFYTNDHFVLKEREGDFSVALEPQDDPDRFWAEGCREIYDSLARRIRGKTLPAIE